MQRTAREREAAATRITEFQPAMKPGLVQTAGYARELLHLACGPAAWGATDDDIEEMVAERIRRQEVLYDRDKHVQLLLGEAALRTRFGSTDTLVGQLDRLVALAGLAHVELAVVPFSAPLPVFPLGGFKVHDAELVIVESLTGEQLLSEPDEVALYSRFVDELRGAALAGADAIALVRTVMSSLLES